MFEDEGDNSYEQKGDPEERAENSIVQQVPPINYYESDIMKPGYYETDYHRYQKTNGYK